MPRKKLIRVKRLPYHVTTRTKNSEFFPFPFEQVWEMALQSLLEAHKLQPINLISFVLMGNHYHMLLITPEGNIDLFMYEFNKRFANKLNTSSAFNSRYKWSLIRSVNYFSNCYRYVYQNPIRANLCLRAEKYPFSTLHYIANGIPFPVPIFDKFGFKDKFKLDWVNQIFSEEEVENIRKKLRRYVEPVGH